MERVIALIDMDCFFVQVEQRERPELWGKPVVLASHAREAGPGRIGVVSYEARNVGVKRKMTISQAKAICPDLNVCFAFQGEHLDKADVQKYRDASAEIFDVFNNFDERIIVELASIDEAFLDMTELVDQTIVEIGAAQLLHSLTSNLSTTLPTTYVADGNDRGIKDVYDREASVQSWLENRCATEISHLRLAVAAKFVEQLRARIRELTQFHCSGGIANNKMLAKLICARHKPGHQTIIPFDYVPVIFSQTPVGNIRMLGGKLGQKIQNSLRVETMGDLAAVPIELIEKHFGRKAQWISQMAKETMMSLLVLMMSTQGKTKLNSLGKNALITVLEVRRYINELCKELCEKLVADRAKICQTVAVFENFAHYIQNRRTAENIIVGIINNSHVRASRTAKITSYTPQAVTNAVWGAAKTFNKAPLGSDQWLPPVFNLSMIASRFIEGRSVQSQNIMEWVEKRLQSNEVEQDAYSSTTTTPPEQKTSGDVRPSDMEMPCTSAGTDLHSDSPRNVSADKKMDSVVKIDDDGWQVYDPALFEDVFEELPRNIKAELDHFHKLEQARRLKAAAEREKKPSGKKRASNANAKGPAAKRKLEDFFHR